MLGLFLPELKLLHYVFPCWYLRKHCTIFHSCHSTVPPAVNKCSSFSTSLLAFVILGLWNCYPKGIPFAMSLSMFSCVYWFWRDDCQDDCPFYNQILLRCMCYVSWKSVPCQIRFEHFLAHCINCCCCCFSLLITCVVPWIGFVREIPVWKFGGGRSREDRAVRLRRNLILSEGHWAGIPKSKAVAIRSPGCHGRNPVFPTSYHCHSQLFSRALSEE